MIENKCKNVSDFIKLLRYNNNFNPFHYSFNKEKIRKSIGSYLKMPQKDIKYANIVEGIFSILPSLNKINNDTKKNIIDNIDSSTLDIEALQDCILAYTNHYYLYSINKTISPKNKTLNFEQALSHAQPDALKNEHIITVANNLISFLNYHKKNYKKSLAKIDENKILEKISLINLYAQINYIYKSYYEECLFLKYQIIQKRNGCDSFLYAEMTDKDFFEKLKVNEIRYNKYIFMYLSYLNKNRMEQEILARSYNRKSINKSIKNVQVNNFVVSFDLEDNPQNDAKFYQELTCHIKPFYSFLAHYPEIFELVDDFLILYSKLLCLFDTIVSNMEYEEILNLKSLRKIPNKIQKTYLEEYLIQSTNIDKTLIKRFLVVLTNDNNVNFFKKPLIYTDNNYIFQFLSSTGDIVTNLIDDWLEENGFPMNERGKIFEKYIKASLITVLEDKGYTFKTYDKNNFKNSQGEQEEIDLIIVLDEIVLLGEAKCTKYPLEIRDIDNNKQRIWDGIEQIKRKKKFVEDNIDIFNINGIELNNKKIIPFVITNFPIFSGLIEEEIPIVDYELLRNYVNTGALIYAKLDENNIEYLKKRHYYTNQKSFEENFEKFLFNPLPILDVAQNLNCRNIRMIDNEEIFQLINPKLFIEKYMIIEKETI